MREKIEILGGKVIELNVLSCHSRIKRYVSFGNGILKVLRNSDYAGVHANTGSVVMLSLISFFAWIGHAKIRIVHAHSVWEQTEKYKIIKILCTPILLLFPTHYFAVSFNAGKYSFPKSVLKRLQIVPNGIDTKQFTFNIGVRMKLRNELRINDRFVIGHVGAFTESKNHSFLIDIFIEILQSCENAVLMLIGDGELRKKIKDRIEKNNLMDSVIFVGSSNCVNKYYQAMDCFVFPSKSEGLGLVAIEAQAAGLPTLCSDAVPKETKLTSLIEYLPLSESVNKWANKILSYRLNNERLDTSAEILKAGFDIHQAAKHLEEIYMKIIP